MRASETAISTANRGLQSLEAQARSARAAIAQLDTQRSTQEQSLERTRPRSGACSRRAPVTGISGSAPDFVRLALSGEDLADAARKLHYLTYVSRAAAQMIDSHRTGLAEVARLKADSESKARELAAIEAQSRADRDLLLKERREHRHLLDRIAGEIRDAKKKIQRLLADESRLSRLVEEIGKVLAARPGAGYARITSVPESGAQTPGLFSPVEGNSAPAGARGTYGPLRHSTY